MKIQKTLLFLLWNPAPFIAYFLACWILFSASTTMSDDPFVHGALPDAAEAAEGAFADLPGSLWKLVTAFSFIMDEIVRDFSYYIWPMMIPFALIFACREARSNRNGIATERKAWMQWYDRQQLVKAQQGTYETPPLAEHIPGDAYFISARKTVLFMLQNLTLPVGHLVCWLFVFALMALPVLFDTGEFLRRIPEIVIPAVIFTLILSYREARGNLKGIAIERHIWTQWYHRQSEAMAQESAFEEPPSSENTKAYRYFGEIPEVLSFMVCHPKPFIIYLTGWVSACALLFFTTLEPWDVPEDILETFDLIGHFAVLLPWIAAIVFIISYREAKGNLKGIAKAQNVWMQWYHRRQETLKRGDTFAEPPPSENTRADSYLKKAQKAVQRVARNPMALIAHLISWFSVVIFLYGGIRNAEPILFLAILAVISCYQEARGTVKGVAKEGEVWTKWYQRQTGAEAQGYTLAEVPQAIKGG